MNTKARWLFALAVTAGACFRFGLQEVGAGDEGADAAVVMTIDGAAQGSAAAALPKDPSWAPACREVGLIRVGDGRQPGALKNFCLNAEGNILACYAPGGVGLTADAKDGPGVRVYSPEGKLLNTLPLEIKPCAICVAKDGSIFVAGDGRVLKLDRAGRVLASAASPVAAMPVAITPEIEEMVKQSIEQTGGAAGRSVKEELARMKTSLERRRGDITGLAATEQDVFVAVPSPNEFTYRVYRLDHALQNPTLVVENLRGCCGQMDIQAHEGNLWIPHNARHSVESRDRDGTQLTKFGTAGRVKASDFGGCCEPKNLRVLPDGDILAAESGPPTCIKQFSATGKFIKVIAALESDGDCVRVTVDRSPDGSRYYMLDTTRDAIRIFGPPS